MRRIKSNRQTIKSKHQRAFRAAAQALDQANRKVISEPRTWQGFEGSITKRKSGETVVGAYRNIVDLKNLRDSQRLAVEDGRATITWDGRGKTPPQAVYFGFRTEKNFVPGRPWAEVAIQEYKDEIIDSYVQNFRKD